MSGKNFKKYAKVLKITMFLIKRRELFFFVRNYDTKKKPLTEKGAIFLDFGVFFGPVLILQGFRWVAGWVASTPPPRTTKAPPDDDENHL